MKHHVIVGIIGGMGPMATVDLFQKVVKATQASNDQEHVHLIIDNNTDIPDRSAHILGHGPDPVPEIERAIDKLILDGAAYLAMPCNTAHYYFDILKAYAEHKNPHIQFVHMIKETASVCESKSFKKLLLLATEGTYHTHLYREIFSPLGIDVVYPSESGRQVIMAAIYDYKKGVSKKEEALVNLLIEGEEQAVDAIILGCTELPLLIDQSMTSLPLVDPSEALAQKLATLK